MSKWKPDYIRRTPDGGTVEVRKRRTPGMDGAESFIEVAKDAQGNTVRVRHFVRDRDGNIIHEHEKHVRKRP
jgi:hypothetical protein